MINNLLKWKRPLLLFLMGIWVAQAAIAQDGATVSGTITSEEDGQPLPGVNVLLKNTASGTITDLNGKYTVPITGDDDIIVFSFIGYLTEEVVVNGRSVIDLVLVPDIQRLSELVVVGYGTQKKSDLTGSIVSFSAEEIEKQGPKVNVLQALQGSVPGLNITQTGNSASQGDFNVSIRGQNSITANNQPLIVLDGVPYSGGFNEIDQNDIQSIEVLKDASSAAIYGSRGANGVIIITTKKGTAGKPEISYDGSYGFQEIYNEPNILTGPEYWDFAVERVGEDVVQKFPTVVKNYEAGNYADWIDLATRQGKQQRHTVKVSGGTDNVNYYISTAYTNVKGVAVGDQFQQLLTRLNLSVNITDWLEIGTNTQYSFQDNSGIGPQLGNGDNSVFFSNPLIDVYDEDGNYNVKPWPEEPIFANPMSNTYVQDEDINRRLFTNNYLLITFPFVEGLSYRLNTGYTYYTNSIGRFWGSNTITGLLNSGQAFVSDSKEKDLLIENIVSFQRRINKHNFDFTGLISTQTATTDTLEITSSRFPTEVLTWYQHNVAEVIEPRTNFSKRNYVSQMARFNYGFDSRYLLTLTVRRDGYSGFGQDTKFGVFPSIALGWNISEEAFLSGLEQVDLLKLRLSYGLNGNQAISPYETLPRLDERPFLGGPNGTSPAPGYYPFSLATPNLGWETTKSLNVGVDFQILKNRIGGSIDVYQSETEDLLLARSISPVHGITTVLQNIGRTKNSGVELNLNSINIQKDNFSWSTLLTFSRNKNEILDLYGDGQDDVASGWFIGQPIEANFDFIYDGVWQVGEDNALQPDAKPGDVKIKDVNNDGQITVDDRDFIGHKNPVFTGGLVNNFNYKNFSLSFSFYTQQGATRVNPLWDTDVVYLDARRNTVRQNWWSEDNPTNAYPANRNNTNPFAVRFYQDASFARLRDITVAYVLPKTLTNSVGLKTVRVYGNIKNALTFTSWEGLDPELSEQRNIPIDRTFMIGINVGL